MNEPQSQSQSLSSVLIVVGLLVLAGGGALWLWMGGGGSQTTATTPATDHGSPIASQLASINSQGVVHLTSWGYDVKKAFAQAKTSGKPVLLMATADWCGPCQKLKKEVLSLPDVDQKIHARFTPVVWDLTEPSEQDIEQATKWKITEGIPAMVIFDAQGNPVKRLIGAVPQERFLQWLGG